MRLTNTQRLTNLVGNLIKNPDLIIPYIQHNLLQKKFPIDLNMPWWSYRAIEYVDTIVENKKIFEYGSGGSTVRFAEKAKSIDAVEDNADWINLVEKKLHEKNCHNVRIKFSPFDFRNPVGFEKSEYIKAVDADTYDIIIIDGQDRTFRERIKCFQYVEPRMKTEQFIIVDDFWRYRELLKANRAKDIKVFESVGPCRFGVTSTAVFVY